MRPAAEVGTELDPLGQLDAGVLLGPPLSRQFESFTDFVGEVSSKISIEGMLIETIDPKPPGTVFDFVYSIGGDVTLIEGSGEVVWLRPPEDDEGRTGMGVRFLDLSDSSRDYVQRMVDVHLQGGAAVFDLSSDGPPEGGSAEDCSSESENGGRDDFSGLVDRAKISETASGGSSIDWDGAEGLAADSPERSSSIDWDDDEDSLPEPSLENDFPSPFEAEEAVVASEAAEAASDSSPEATSDSPVESASDSHAEVSSDSARSVRRGTPWRGSWSRC